MSEKKSFKLPLGLILLDGLGTVLVGLGLAKMFAGIDVLPASFQASVPGWALIVVGCLMMLPFVLFFLSKIRERVEKNIVK